MGDVRNFNIQSVLNGDLDPIIDALITADQAGKAQKAGRELMKTKIIGKDDLNTAAALIAAGQLVAVPTETVYGLACSGLDADAVEQVYEVKGRPEVKPLSLMLHKGALP